MNLNILVIILSSIVVILSIRLWRSSLLIKKITKSTESIYNSAKKLMEQNDTYTDVCNKQLNVIKELKNIINRQNNKVNINYNDELDIDNILDKIRKLGIDSITEDEINFLKNYKN